MGISRKTAGNATILTVSGELDASNLEETKAALDAAIGDAPGTRLVCNLRGVSFLNSSSLGALIAAAKQLRSLEGELVVSEPSKFFQTIVRTVGVDRVFRIFPDDEEALKYFRDQGGKEATEFEGIPMDEKLLGSTKMYFRLVDDPGATAEAKILSLWEDGPTFKYPADPDKVKIDPDELTIGRKLAIRFREPFLEKERYFEMEAEIVLAVDVDDGDDAAKYRLRYTKIDENDRKVLEQFVRDQDLFRKEGRPPPPE